MLRTLVLQQIVKSFSYIQHVEFQLFFFSITIVYVSLVAQLNLEKGKNGTTQQPTLHQLVSSLVLGSKHIRLSDIHSYSMVMPTLAEETWKAGFTI